MNQFLQVIQNLGASRITAIVGAAAVVLGTLIFVLTRLNTPDLALLYADLEPADTDEIVTQLSAQNIPFEIRGQGDQILVPSDQVGPMRLAMAQLGLPTSGTVGYEIFDREQSIGTSSFVQEVNQLRALEGELARTIASLAPVKGARVHLVLPQRELFTRERQEPSASVILRMKGANRLDRSQVLAIQHLVAAAVPRLKPGSISIVDDRGSLLARGGDGETGMSGETVDEMRAAYESRLARRLESLLENTVGIGKVRAEVRAVMDFSQQVVEEEEFNPDGQVLRSTESIEESALSEDGAADNVTVEQNLPDAPDALGGGGSREQSSRLEERSNYEINRRAINTVIAPGRIQQLSVAVLVDGHYRDAEDGTTTTYEARSTDEMEQIEKLVRSAIGFGADGRDDVVEVINMQFADVTMLAGEEDQQLFGFPTSELLRYAEKFVLAVLFILVLLMIVRPILARLMEVGPSALAEVTGAGGELMLADESGMAGAPQLAAPGAAPGVPAVPGEEGDADQDEVAEEFETMIDIAQVEGRVKASSLRKIGEIIEKHPEEAVSIMRTWITQDN